MDNNRITTIRKTSSGIGFMLYAASLTMYAISIIFTIVFYSMSDTTLLFLTDIIISIISLFIIGIIYCGFSRTSLSEVIQVKWIRLSLAVPMVLVALTVSFTADYLTDILQNSFALFGIENNVDLSSESHTLIENILNITAVSVIPPLVEEFLFRGIVLGKLRPFGDSFALFISSALFALMHGNIIQIPFAFIVGLSLAFITIKSNSILPAIFVHFFVNLRSVLVSIFYDNKLISEQTLNNIYLISIFVVFVLGIVSAAFLSKKKDFFKLESDMEIPFRQAVKSSVLSVGMIFFIVHSFLTTLQTISVSWQNLDSYLF